ncbi:thioredoxin [candidate division WWE3 bacterium RBG_13_37_7]|uniref:Thioredoxin n=1 Tax=candidate division WWE3 bacterium RBG_13_37_7 TaxID=1802609 RepID=A0A1F4U1G4_UNCKA|nr:MAG: thioredoxin [candidate division WWE3 bacterium RBG_13_37_7]
MITLIDFYADWCGPCKIMAPIFVELEKEFDGKVEFKKVDVEVNSNMASEFQVMSIPTFVIQKNGKEVDRKLGAMPKEILKSWIESYLK